MKLGSLRKLKFSFNFRVISSSEYPFKPARGSQDNLIMYPVFDLNATFSKILFSLLQLLHGSINMYPGLAVSKMSHVRQSLTIKHGLY